MGDDRLKVPVRVRTPTVPNFVDVMPDIGTASLTGVDVADLSDHQIRIIGRAWTRELLANAERRRAERRRVGRGQKADR